MPLHGLRSLRSMLDALSAVRWAPLAATVDALAASPAAMLAAFAPDPFALLARDGDAPGAAAAAPAAAKRQRATVGREDVSRRAPSAVPPAVDADARTSAPLGDVPPAPRFKTAPAAAGVRRAATVPPAPALRVDAKAPALPPEMLAALMPRFGGTAPVDPVAIDTATLRAMAAAAEPKPAAPATTPAAAAKASTRKSAAVDDLSAAPAARRPADAVPPARAEAPEPAIAALSPQGRPSQLAELLQRWPGAATTTGVADTPIAATRLPLAPARFDALPALGTSTPLNAPTAVDTGDLPLPASLPNDLTFSRTLERVLLAELRRQGLDLT